MAEENLKSKEDLLKLKDQQILDEKDKVKFMNATIKNLQSYLANDKDIINVLNREILKKTEHVKHKDELLTLKENEIRNKCREIENLNEQILAKDGRIVGLKNQIKTFSEKLVKRTNHFEKCKGIGSFEAPWDSDGWNIIQRRQDGSVSFNRSWLDYKNGFGYLTGEFFIGLEKLHQMTKDKPHELYIELGNDDGEYAFAHYDNFQIGSEEEFYKLKRLGRYSGSANSGDGLRNQEERNFSTFDRDNGAWGGYNCMESYSGGWWYSACDRSLPNGKYNYDVEWPFFGPCDIVEMRIKRINL
ncbi:fibroleukin-like [Drosophila takahashii]|uniref:fibroleukin-like n=1 Tax=Drosophila takahashii TaxID=29030 RepID=UPI001CF835F2|nr:fibroleukin-like [Drosophila takahashii]